jgi:hypothetical protein
LDVRDERRDVFDWEIQVFEHTGGGRYQLHEETISERGYATEQIREGLLRRFGRVRVLDPNRARPSVRSERLWFVAGEPRARRITHQSGH